MNSHSPGGRRRLVDVSLDEKLVAEAQELGVDLSRACEAALAAEVRRQRWVAENWEAIQSSNAYVVKHGLPLAKYRQF